MGRWMGVATVLAAAALGCGQGDGGSHPDAADAAVAVDRPVDTPASPDASADLPRADAAVDAPADRDPDAAPDVSRPDAPPPASFVLLPDMFDFQTVPVGMSRSQVFQLKNTGGQISGTPSISLTGGPPGVFRIIDDQCQTALETEGDCLIEVQFTPGAAGAQGALLEAEAAPGGRVSSQLDGTGQ